MQDDFELGIRKSSSDKLTYKNIIADAINWCRRTQGTFLFPGAVKGLVGVIRFNVKGYNLKQGLEEIEKQMEIEKKLYIQHIKTKLGRDFYGASEQAKFKIRLNRWTWNTYYEKIIQLLATNGLLMDIERIISVRSAGENQDE